MSESTVQPSAAENPLLEEALDAQRRALLDIGKRNPLTNSPLQSNRRNQLIVVDELSDEIFRILYTEGKKFTFLPGSEVNEINDETEIFDDTYAPEELKASVNAAHVDTKLQSKLPPAALHQKLLYMYREAKSVEEEQGVSVLFLALGFLRYYESESSDTERFAPLILLPVDLSRDSRKGVFRLSKRDADLESNKSLGMMLREDFQLVLPELPSSDTWKPSNYFSEVAEAMSSKTRWTVEKNRMALSFFSFAKFLMYSDLNIENFQSENADVASVQLIGDLLTGSQSSTQNSVSMSITAPEQAKNLDSKFSDPKDLGHILDADSSQTLVIASAVEGKNIVVQGPPGTGKSQTIANIIAAAVSREKRVLFIAEKRAALDVVMKRLVQCGLGPLCLELHSHKANRSEVYASLKETLELDKPIDVMQAEYDELRRLRDDLNQLSELIHTRDSTTGNTAFRVMGRISRLYGKGTPPANFDVPEIDTWSIAQFNERQGMVRRFAGVTKEYGSEYEHIWRGVEKRLTPIDRQRLQGYLDQVPQALANLAEQFEECSKASSVEWELTGRSVDRLRDQLTSLLDMPTVVPTMLQNELVSEHYQALLALCELLAEVQSLESELSGTVSRQAFEMQWELHLNALVKDGSSFLRWMKSSYRNAIRDLKSICREKLAKDAMQRVSLLEKLVEANELRRKIENQDSLGREFFGVEWQRFATNYSSSEKALAWIDSQIKSLGDIHQVQRQVANLDASTDLEQFRDQLTAAWEDWNSLWTNVLDLTGLDCSKAFGSADIEELEIREVHDRFLLWNEQADGLAGYHELLSAGDLLSNNGLEEVRSQISSGQLSCDHAVDTFTLLRSERVWKSLLRTHPKLENLSGSDRTALVNEFRIHDEKLRLLAAQEVMLKHHQNIPRGTQGMAGIVRGEIAKKRRHMPIRKLLDTAGDVVARLKPVFLMSPLSVAQFLKPNGLKFDLLLVDEASQVKPAEALGAILRAKQIVVVGDQKQMPPTSFFDRQMSGDSDHELDTDEDSDEQSDELKQLLQQSSEMESILALCDARFGHNAMLSWHYRSEHPSLIEVSNHEFYDGKLTYPPSPEFGTTTNGMSFVHVKNGVYDRGKRRHNEQEAAEICDHIWSHVQDHPDWSLGVVALSVAQRDLIQTRMEERCREYPDMDKFCDEGREEPFFVKNLENVQGDERDVIFVSIGYGKDKDGYFGQSFGPVSQDGGERRLNVLFTRARKRCVVFASITHEDIRVDTSRYNGPRVLKRFMKFAQTGEHDVPIESGDEMDSPFEEDVASVLVSYGYNVHAQVGASGFKIDLAIADPDTPNHYLLAIECDGARYHSSSWARERDRLRQQVLEGKGWRFHRIWSTDWFYSRDSEIQKLIKAIEEAQQYFRSQGSAGSTSSFQRSGSGNDADTPSSQSAIDGDMGESSTVNEESKSNTTSSVDIVTRTSSHDEVVLSSPYLEPTFDVDPELRALEIHEIDQTLLAPAVEHVVKVEGPVHADVITSRIALIWDKRRVGARIRATVRDAIDIALRKREIYRSASDGEEFFTDQENHANEQMRNRSDTKLAKVKSPEFIPKSEIRQAILIAVQQNMSLSVNECVAEVQRLLGTTSGRAKMTEQVDIEALGLASSGQIKRTDNTLSVVS